MGHFKLEFCPTAADIVILKYPTTMLAMVKNMVEAYCVKCRKKVEMKDAQKVTMKNGKPAMQGVCPNCGTKVFKIGSQ